MQSKDSRAMGTGCTGLEIIHTHPRLHASYLHQGLPLLMCARLAACTRIAQCLCPPQLPP